jgi:uncharacterized phage-associated protein
MNMDIYNVAKFFLHRVAETGEEITNLKLQKLCYYAQAWHLVRTGQPLMNEAVFQAWDLGPVCPTLYRSFKSFGRSSIALADRFIPEQVFGAEQLASLEFVWVRYGMEMPEHLVTLTHNEDPWKDVYAEGENNVITNNSMNKYYAFVYEAEKLIQAAQQHFISVKKNGNIISDPTEQMVDDMKENYDLSFEAAGIVMKDYLERVR